MAAQSNHPSILTGLLWAPAAVLLGLGSAVGLFVPVQLPVAFDALLLWLLIALVFLRRRSLAGPFAAGCVLLLLGVFRGALSMQVPLIKLDLPLPRTEPPIQWLQVHSEPEWTENGHRFVADWLAVCRGTPGQPGLDCQARQGLVRVDVRARDVRVQAGDRVRVPAFTQPPPGYQNPGAYDLRANWQRQGIIAEVHVNDARRIAIEPSKLPQDLSELAPWLAAKVRSTFGQLRRRWSQSLTEQVSGRTGQTLTALALGEHGSTDLAWNNWLVATGTAHIIAVSGSHLALVVWLMRTLLRFFVVRLLPNLLRRRPIDAWLALPCILTAWSYALLTGSAGSTLRAAWMATVLLSARAVGLRPPLAESLGFAVFALLLVDPAVVADLGLLLSIAGVLGLAWAGGDNVDAALPLLQKLRAHLIALWRSCLAPHALTAPIALLAFGSLPLLAPVANLLVVPYAGVIMLPCALLLTLWANCMQTPLINRVAQLLMQPIDWLVALPDWLWPVWRGQGTLSLCVGLLPMCLLAAYWHRGRWLKRAVLLLCLTALAFFWQKHVDHVPYGHVRVTMLDVGHGDCTLLEFADDSVMLVDAGGFVGDDGAVGRLAVLPYLQRHRIRKIDRMVLTHGHPDHENGLLAVARAMPVGEFWWNGQQPHGAEHKNLMIELLHHGAKWRDFAAYGLPVQRSFRLGGVDIEVVWPPADQAPFLPVLDFNDNSLVLQINAGHQKALLAGDIEESAELALVRSGVLQPVTLLKVAHHGSKTSSTDAFLDAVQPRLAIAGARPWGQLPFPHLPVVKRFAERVVPFWITDGGWIQVELGGDGAVARQGQRTWSTSGK